MTPHIADRILKLKREKGAVILAHNYQRPEVQDIADIVGDSFELALKAKTLEPDIVVFCGVHFMAESCKILAPEKTVLLPAMDAGCPLADTITAEGLRRLKKEHPGIPVVTYINSTAAVKAESDYCCTSANAARVVNAIDSDTVIFAPDANLGSFVQQHTRKKLLLWDGHCIVHQRVLVEEILQIKAVHDNAPVIAHPECQPDVVGMADVVCSTSRMIPESKNAPGDTVIIVTEAGMLHPLKKAVPEKHFILASPKLICRNMKKITLNNVLEVLETGRNSIHVDPITAKQAMIPLSRMLSIGADMTAKL
ncbi:MAG: quinolinate synthase NadA [Acidobacteria bacterium]|nr:quinolinate synthase NadA [Acidobacteriota bacterium]